MTPAIRTLLTAGLLAGTIGATPTQAMPTQAMPALGDTARASTPTPHLEKAHDAYSGHHHRRYVYDRHQPKFGIGVRNVGLGMYKTLQEFSRRVEASFRGLI